VNDGDNRVVGHRTVDMVLVEQKKACLRARSAVGRSLKVKYV